MVDDTKNCDDVGEYLQKMARLRQWCEDATAASAEEIGAPYRFIYVDQESFQKHQPRSLSSLSTSFTEYQKP